MTGNSARPISILMTTDTVGGVWTYTMELCRALVQKGVRIFLVTEGGFMNPWQKQEVEALGLAKVYETEHLLEWMPDAWENIDRAGKWLQQLAATVQPDVVHLNGYSYASLDFNCPTIVVAHSDVFSWYFAVKEEAPGEEWNEYYRRVKRGLDAASMVVSPSLSSLHVLRQVFNPVAPRKVIYNGRNHASFHSKTKEPFVFSMGRLWDEAKNIQLLLDCAPQVKGTIKIAGAAKFGGDAVEVNHPNVQHLGKLSSAGVAEQLAKASVYVLPARYEPFGLSILEAALSGCALVLASIDTLEEIWQENALYVDPNDRDGLARAINTLLTDKQMLEHYAGKAYQHALQFSTAFMADQYYECYQSLLPQNVPLTQALV